LTALPDVLVLLHAKDNNVVIKEANQVGVPSVGIVDTNADGSGLVYPVYGNDDSLEAQFLYTQVFCEVLKPRNGHTPLTGKVLHDSRKDSNLTI
jgi:small subunit ribosomal protein S2